jgi:hypothetical protein
MIATGGSTFNISGDDSGTGDDGATVTLYAASGGYTVTEGSKLNVTSYCGIAGRPFTDGSKGQPAVIQQIPNGTFHVTGEGSEMNLKSYGYSNQSGATIRFREAAAPTFNIADKAKVTIEKYAPGTGGAPPALRYGLRTDNATFSVSGGAEIIIENHAGGKANDKDNNGIDFATRGWNFNISGAESAVKITADYGPAITGAVADGSINLGKGAIFLAEGQTASAGKGTINTGSKFTFKADEPLYYNFENFRLGGGLVFSVGNNSTFLSQNSDASFWRNGANYSGTTGNSNDKLYNHVEGDPFRSWVGLTYSATGSNFGSLSSSDDSSFNENPGSFGSQGMKIYTRINGNNAPPSFQGMASLTNADKYVRAFGTVREGLPTDTPRPLYTGEAFGRLQHNGSSTLLTMTSIFS